MISEEGLQQVFLRHRRLAEATRRAVRAWGLEIWAANPEEYSSSTTAVQLPEGFSEVAFRALVLQKFNMSMTFSTAICRSPACFTVSVTNRSTTAANAPPSGFVRVAMLRIASEYNALA